MLSALAIVLGTAWGVVVVHEHGHRIAARLLGVPAHEVAVVYGFPSHTALLADDVWLSPDDDGYADAFRAHRPGAVAGWVFVAAGFVVEALVALGLGLTLVSLGLAWAALLLTSVSAVVFVGYVLVDVVLGLVQGRQLGDASAMWSLLPLPTLLLLLLVAGTKAAALALAWSVLSP